MNVTEGLNVFIDERINIGKYEDMKRGIKQLCDKLQVKQDRVEKGGSRRWRGVICMGRSTSVRPS